MSAYSYIQLFKHTNCLSYNLKSELFILGITLFFSMSLYGFIVIQRLLILWREIFSLQHYIQNKALCKTLSISPDLSPISKISLRLNSEAIFPHFLSWPANVHTDMVCWKLSVRKQIATPATETTTSLGRLLLSEVQLLFSFPGAGPTKRLWMC